MITLEQMLLSSVHLGHKVKQWNPKMSPYIYAEMNGVHIIDLLQTLVCLKKACKFLKNLRLENKKVLFVCIKRQFKLTVEKLAIESSSFYVTQRWLGGMLTNWVTIKACIERLRFLLSDGNDLSTVNLTKKEILILDKKKIKLKKYFGGVYDMSTLPNAVILIGLPSQLTVVKECKRMGIPILSILDTNCDPFLIDYFVPANDDSLSSISLILQQFKDALL